MSIGKTYKEAFQKAIRSLETGRYGLGHAKDFDAKSKKELLKMLIHRLANVILLCMRHFAKVQLDEIIELTKVRNTGSLNK